MLTDRHNHGIAGWWAAVDEVASMHLRTAAKLYVPYIYSLTQHSHPTRQTAN